LNRSAGGNSDQGRGVRRRPGWLPGQVRSPMDLARIHPARRVSRWRATASSGRSAGQPARPLQPSWRIASPSKKQS